MSTLPVIYVYKKILFPGCTGEFKSPDNFPVAKGDSILLSPVASIFGRFWSLKRYATLCRVEEVKRKDEGAVLELRGISQEILLGRGGGGESEFARVVKVISPKCDDLVSSLRRRTQEFVFLVDTSESEKLIYLMNFINNPSDLCDFVANYFIFDYRKKLGIYKETDVFKRISLTISIIEKLIDEVNKRKN